MKKILFSLAVVLGFASCNTWDEESSEKFNDGPAVSINLTTTTDSTFTFSVTPAQGANYYSYVVVKGSAAKEVPAESVLKTTLSGGIAGGIIKVANSASVTENMCNAKGAPLCQPNTSYVVYAVASSTNGVTGDVASLVVKTTDGNAPVVEDFPAGKDSTAYVVFSEAVALAEASAVKAYYYKDFDENLEKFPISSENYTITVDGSKVAFDFSGVPAGAHVFVSWSEGAFVDSFGNKCPAVNSDFNMETFESEGVYVHLPNVQWTIDPKCFGPETGALVADYKAFKGTITFKEEVFRNDYEAKAGDFSVVYAGSNKTSVIKLATNAWSVSGKVVTFTLPEAPAAGDKIYVQIAEDVLFDIYGNGNKEFNSTAVWWKFYQMKKEDCLGNFTLKYQSYYDNPKQWYNDENVVTIVEDASRENGLIIKNFYMPGSELKASYNIEKGKVYVEDEQLLGIYNHQKYGALALLFVNPEESAPVEFSVNPDGTIVGEFVGVYALTAADGGDLGFWDILEPAVLTKSKVSATKATAFKSAKKSTKTYTVAKRSKKMHIKK